MKNIARRTTSKPRIGHSAGKPTTKIIDETADRWAFLVKELGMKIAK
jgi:prolyl oligopeptidase PreP (S9A serine peptidase family)